MLKKLLSLSLVFAAWHVTGQPVVSTTPYSRTLLRASDAATARSILGVLATNNWPVMYIQLIGPLSTNPTNNGGFYSGGVFSSPTNTGGVYSNGNFRGSVSVNPTNTGGVYSNGNFQGSVSVNPTNTGGVYSNGVFSGTLNGNPENIFQNNLPWSNKRLNSHFPYRVMFWGNSVGFDVAYTLGPYLGQYMPTNGFEGTGYPTVAGDYFNLSTTSGTLTWTITSYWPTHVYCMGNNSTVTTTSYMPGFNANTVELFYFASNGFGQLTVATNVNGGAFATLATVVAATAGPIGLFTNWYFTSQSNMMVKVTSTGTNILGGIGIWNTNSYQGFHFIGTTEGGQDASYWLSGGGYINSSNSFKNLLAGTKPDLLLMEFKNSDISMSNAIPQFLNLLQAAGATNTDFIAINPHPEFPDTSTMTAQRAMVNQLAQQFNFTVFDLWSLFEPTNPAGGFFYSDATHLNAAGTAFVGAKFCNWLGLAQELPGMGYTVLSNLNFSGFATLGANTFNGVQKINGTLYATNAIVLTPAGDTAGFGLEIFVTGTAIDFVNEADGYIPLSITPGYPYTTFNCAENAGELGNTTPWVLYGTNSAINFAGNGISQPTNYSSANFAPLPGCVKIVPSNNWLYIVSQYATNALIKTQP